MPDDTASGPRKAIFPRLYWMLLGPALMFLAAGLLAKHPAWSLGWRDLVFWGAIASLVGARWLDVRRFAGLTADGEPATLHHVRRHALLVVGVGIAVWVLTQSIQV